MALSSAIGGGLGLGMFMAISVGPTLFAVIRYSMNHSYKAGLAFVMGVSLSDILYVTVANLATPFLQMLNRYETQLAYGGGAILVVMGIVGLLKKYKPVPPTEKLVTLSGSHYISIFGSGFLMNTVNPGVVLNWLAAVTVIATKTADLSHRDGTLYRLVFFGCCLALVLGIDFLKVLLADSIRKRLTLKLTRRLNKLSAAILLLFGVVIITITVLHIGFSPDDIKKDLHLKKKSTVQAFNPSVYSLRL